MVFGAGKALVAATLAFVAVAVVADDKNDAGSLCCPFSDLSLKDAVRPLDSSTQQLMQLKGVQFNWKDSGRQDIGLIAQDVQKVYPQVVHEKQGLLTVDYQKLVAPLIESVRELNARIEVLEKAQAK
ncbi:tail fiber domain-containing protein [Pseudomonas alabamensis]|uniref:tail fiber domain-containing protein n=1 Tax=Pseudomonas alabamensis TaxID=3064349 RepID=UPI003F64E6A9